MNEERYILAELKRRLAKGKSDRDSNLYYNYEVLTIIAEIEADAVLGEETDEGLPFTDEEADA